jgi:hypothetical protein
VLKYLIFLISICSILSVAIFETIDFKFLDKNWHDLNTQFDSYLGWSPIPNTNTRKIRTNSWGFRSDEIDQEKDQIIVLGDSVAFGLGLKNEQTVPYYLNEEFKVLNYQVQNLAVSGYGVDQYYLFLKQNIEKFKKLKYVVVIICTANDYENTINDSQYGKRKPLFTLKGNEPVLSNVPINKFDLRNIFSESKMIQKLSRSPNIEKFFDEWAGHKTLSSLEGERLIRVLFEKINKLTLEHNAKLVFVLSPLKDDLFKKSSQFTFFEDLLRSQQYPYINFLDILKRQESEINSIYIDKDICHYTPLGSKILEESLSKFLKASYFQSI